MPDRNQNQYSRTGEFPTVDGDARIDRESIRPKSLPEMPEDSASSTGVMPIYKEPNDEIAERDQDTPDKP